MPDLNEAAEALRKELGPVVERLGEQGLSNKDIAYGIASFGIGMMDGIGVPVHDIDVYLRTFADKILLRRPRA